MAILLGFIGLAGAQADGGPAASLLKAIRAGDHEAIRAALAAGADPNAVDSRGFTPLVHAVRNQVQCSAGLEITAGHWISATQLLIEHGARPSGSVLHDAVRSRCKALVELLADSGADVNAEIAGGLTPTQLADDYGDTDIAAYLRSRGGKVKFGYAFRRALDRFRIPYHSN